MAAVKEGNSVVDTSQNFNLPVKIDDYLLDDSLDVLTADFLVLPIEQENITIKQNGFSQKINL